MRKTHRAQTATRPQDLAPRGLGRIAISFQAAGGALVIILGDLGSKLIVLGI